MTFIYESMQFLFFLAIGLGIFFGIHALEDLLDQQTFPTEITYLHAYSKVFLHVVGYFLATIVLCTYAGINIQLLLASSGLIGAALLFVFNTLVQQIGAGLYVIFTKPFQAGDQLSLINGTNGIVVGFGLQHVVLECKNQFVYVPNTTILTSVIHVAPNKKTPRLSKKKIKDS